jgi:hypothetical protein
MGYNIVLPNRNSNAVGHLIFSFLESSPEEAFRPFRIQVHIADSWRPMDVVLPGLFSQGFLPVITPPENPFADFIQTDCVRAPQAEQARHFHREQCDYGIGKVVASDATSVFVMKQRHGQAAFQPAFNEIDCPFFALHRIAHREAQPDNCMLGGFRDFSFSQQKRQSGFTSDSNFL